jgi:hypothetical protein
LKTARRVGARVACALILGSLVAFTPAAARQPAKLRASADRGAAKENEKTLAAFKQRVSEYVKLQKQLAGKLPKLSTESRPAEIEAHQTALSEQLRARRAGAQPGDLFTPDVARHIRQVIRGKYPGKRLKELRELVSEAATEGVPVRVNFPYPETKELVEMPPPLLLVLPPLPPEVRYRFVGEHLLLVDRETRLIIDFMPDALPGPPVKGGKRE